MINLLLLFVEEDLLWRISWNFQRTAGSDAVLFSRGYRFYWAFRKHLSKLKCVQASAICLNITCIQIYFNYIYLTKINYLNN